MTMLIHKKLRTADAPEVLACTDGGVGHDLRPYRYVQHNAPHVSLVCVWCGGVACGSADHPDPCIKIYHHHDEHQSRFGERWPIGGSRAEPVEP